MLLNIKDLKDDLIDPESKKPIKFEWNGNLIQSVSSDKKSYKNIRNIPILINFKSSVFEETFFKNIKFDNSPIGKRFKINKKIKNFLTGNNYFSKKSFEIFKNNLNKNSKILVIGGGNIGSGSSIIYNSKDIEIISTDVYPNNNIQFISDCHNLPLKDESVDGVIIQAVLEHVLNPLQVVNEIKRILKKDGIVFAETPFMQQSHEEPYDFQRYTALGHRWLFKSFNSIYQRTNGGPGLSLYWSIKYFFYAILNNKFLTNLLSLPFIILSYIDYIIPEKRKLKSANGFVFIGRKSLTSLDEKNIIHEYLGI